MLQGDQTNKGNNASGNFEIEDFDDLSDHEGINYKMTVTSKELFAILSEISIQIFFFSDGGESPFNNQRDLFCHSAHLTVFINYVISNSDPASLVK